MLTSSREGPVGGDPGSCRIGPGPDPRRPDGRDRALALHRSPGTCSICWIPRSSPSRGRPPPPEVDRQGLFSLNHTSGIAVGVDVGEDHTRVALSDLGNQVLVESVGSADLAIGPDAVLNWVTSEITGLLEQLGRSSQDLVGICLGLPAPVDWKTGRASGPSVMPGWDDYDVAGAINRVHAAPVVVDNDVNLLGLAEARRQQPDAESLLYVKAGTGIGGAIVTNGELYRGSRGAAGYIGHVHLRSSVVATVPVRQRRVRGGHRGRVGPSPATCVTWASRPSPRATSYAWPPKGNRKPSADCARPGGRWVRPWPPPSTCSIPTYSCSAASWSAPAITS